MTSAIFMRIMKIAKICEALSENCDFKKIAKIKRIAKS